MSYGSEDWQQMTILIVDPGDLFEDPPVEDNTIKGATSEWLYDHWKNVAAHHVKTIDASELTNGILALARLSGILNAQISASASIAESKLALVKGTQALFDKIGADILTHKSVSTSHHTKTVNASELTAGTLPLARLVDIVNAQISASAAIAESKLDLDQGTQALFDKVPADILTHKGDGSAHHAPVYQASQITEGRFPMTRMLDMADGKIMVGAGSGSDPVASDPLASIVLYIASDDLIASADAEITDYTMAYVKHKEIATQYMASLRTKFDLKALYSGDVLGRIYKNGVAVGTERTTNSTTYITYTEDLGRFDINDRIQLYQKKIDQAVVTRNFRIYGVQENLCPVTLDS